MTYKYGETDQHDCLYNVAREYPGGLEALAPRMGLGSKLLRKKIGPAEKTNNMTWEDVSVALELLQSAGVADALKPMQAMAFRHGMICVPIPDAADVTEEALSAAAMQVMVQLGEAIAASKEAMSDGQLTQCELVHIEPKIRRMLPAIVGWIEKLRLRAKKDTGRGIVDKLLHPRREKDHA